MRRLLPSPADEVDVAAEYALTPGVPWLRANMVATADGAVSDAHGVSGGISGEADRRLFRVLRASADAVVVGARTAETERYRRAAVPIVLLSRSLALDLTTPLLAAAGDASSAAVLVVAPAAAPEERRSALLEHAATVGGIELVTAGADELDLAAATAALRDRGWLQLLCEGGPTLLSRLLAADLVDEVCVTTSPLFVGGPAGRIVHGPALPSPAAWTVAGLYEDDGYLFTRWHHPRRKGEHRA